MRYLSLRVRNALVVHGYDADNQEIVEEVPPEPFAEKLVLVDRIQSVTEKYVLVTSSHGRVMYWEYEGGFAALKSRMAVAGLLLV